MNLPMSFLRRELLPAPVVVELEPFGSLPRLPARLPPCTSPPGSRPLTRATSALTSGTG